jgi:two-component system chemotaxis response regulator CheV
MDGYSFAKNVRATPEIAAIPLILFSSMISNDILHKGQSVGATAQLSKPQIGELLETIRNLCDYHEQPTEHTK